MFNWLSTWFWKGKASWKQLEIKILKKNFMPPFHGWGWTASMIEPLQGGSLLFTTKFPEILLMVLILSTSEGRKAEPTLELPSGFGHRTPGLGSSNLTTRALLHYLLIWNLLISMIMMLSMIFAQNSML